MAEERFATIRELLASHESSDLLTGLTLVKAASPGVTEEGARELCELMLPLFYIDPLDHPEHLPAIEQAILVAADLGEPIIPTLIQNLEAGDVKAQMALAKALGLMGAVAIEPLITEYESTCPDPSCRAFLLYALGKIKSPEIVKAAPLALEAAASPDQELRDTATRALGKFMESIPSGDLPDPVRADIVERLRGNLADHSPGIRAKAVRSLGKMAQHGHLNPRERWELTHILKRLLGQDGEFEWDRAYVVRKEAKEALEHAG